MSILESDDPPKFSRAEVERHDKAINDISRRNLILFCSVSEEDFAKMVVRFRNFDYFFTSVSVKDYILMLEQSLAALFA